MNGTCSVCGQRLVQDVGKPDAPILLVSEFPGVEEIKQGVAFCGKAGKVLVSETTVAHIPLHKCLITNLWLHYPPDLVTSKAGMRRLCYAPMLAELVRKMVGRRAILLMGSELSREFLGSSIMQYAGLKVTSTFLPKDILVMCAPNPASVFKGTIGELRLSLAKFGKELERMGV